MVVSERYDEDVKPSAKAASGASGRHVIAVIGIDRYRHWPPLSNAVRDVTAVAALFRRLGFEEITAPLLGDRATGTAIQSLVTDDLMALGPDDSLVLFYAGHGGTRKHRLGDEVIKAGYLIPVDAAVSPDKVSTWVDLDGWLRAVSLLPARHILVVLDACHSGIALDPIIKWRDIGSWQDAPLATLQARRSRRIITSALDDQVALDSGPVHGHSLFTGCLIEGLTGGIRGDQGAVTTGSELGLYVQRRVQSYPGSRQTPDFGTFAFDDRGEMAIPLAIERALEPPEEPATAARQPATDTVAPTTLAPDARRWIVVGVMATALATALIGYLILGHESPPPVDHRVDTPPPTAAPDLPDARPVDAGPGVALDAPPDAPSQSPGARPGDCPPGMVRVPEGTFRMGSPEGVGNANEHPQHKVTLSAYCIDRTEVTVKAYADCVRAGGCTGAPLTVQWSGVSAEDVKRYSRLCNRDDRPDHPINCVDWNQATEYCTWAGKRLPTEAEWEYAARGSDGRVYPWGGQAPSAIRLNACGTECVAMAKRQLNLDWKSMYDASDSWEATAPVGRFPDGASPVGALDMAGNVWEWIADWYGPYTAAAATDPRGAEAGTARVFRGGAWYSFDAGHVRAAYRYRNGASDRLNYVGFRCARGD